MEHHNTPDRTILNKQNIYSLVTQNRYMVDSKLKFLSRCVDGRYAKEKNLPPVSLPGEDLGELAVIFAAGNTYGFGVDPEKALESLIDLIGGEENFQFHTDSHTDKDILAGGCGYAKELRLHPEAFNLTKDQVEFLEITLKKLSKKGAKQTVLDGSYTEGAVLRLEGNYSVFPEGKVFVFQSTLVNERHKALAQKLLEHNAIKFVGQEYGEEYVYHALSEASDTHLYETLKRLAKNLPIFHVRFDENERFEVEDEGTVV